MSKTNNIIIAGVAIVLCIFVAIIVITNSTDIQDTISNQETAQNQSEERALENGEYSIDQFYQSPGGPDTMKLKITVQDDKITAVEADLETTNLVSPQWHENFMRELPEIIKDKDINEVSGLEKVAGASLSTRAFKEAVKNIIEQN